MSKDGGAIRAKAAELEYNPVKIYFWVRNNVEWLPTWGATQDAELTLSARRGNAMDIASLTVALLRASGIPARYVHGTMDVPVAKYRNWMGGFSDIMAAADYASSGGVPTRVLSEGGQPAWMRMEHVWVEAALDFHPGRAYRNLEADSWIDLDPSFKQYEYLEGIDVAQMAGIDGGPGRRLSPERYRQRRREVDSGPTLVYSPSPRAAPSRRYRAIWRPISPTPPSAR